MFFWECTATKRASSEIRTFKVCWHNVFPPILFPRDVHYAWCDFFNVATLCIQIIHCLIHFIKLFSHDTNHHQYNFHCYVIDNCGFTLIVMVMTLCYEYGCCCNAKESNNHHNQHIKSFLKADRDVFKFNSIQSAITNTVSYRYRIRNTSINLILTTFVLTRREIEYDMNNHVQYQRKYPHQQ